MQWTSHNLAYEHETVPDILTCIQLRTLDPNCLAVLTDHAMYMPQFGK